MIKLLIEKYSNLITRHPRFVLIAMLLLTVFSIYMAGTITTKTSETRDFLPRDVEAIGTLFDIEDEFGSTNIVNLVIEVDPEYAGSNEVRDVRDAKVMRYINNIAELALHNDDVMEVTSPASILKNINGGRLPQSSREIQELTSKNGMFDSYISRDYTIALVKVRTTDDVSYDSIEVELDKILRQVEKPAGVSANPGGTILEQQVMMRSIGPDMAKTSVYSLIGILVIVLVLFRSIKYGFTPMTTIMFGSIWAMGYVGLIGMGLSSATSGVLSMIMGIGIDFGIQVVTRYRFELKNMEALKERHPQLVIGHKDAMAVTLNNVIIPMTTTTLAALIGFQALKLGKLSFMNDMGVIMSYGVAASMIAAITVVPSVILIADTINIKDMYKKLMNRFEVRQ
ncbi:MAG: MMPL family transporter [Candidatus Methanoperedens sp.]|nr:MMPL family transporter [Candidatus Methanoperedens sp.]